MSRNYELLRQMNVEHETWAHATHRDRPTYEMRPVPDTHVLSREELVKLVQTIFLLPDSQCPSVVLFAGVESSSGCSSICAGAAHALAANVAERVCVVDSNLRYPSLHLSLGVGNSKGLSDALLCDEPISEFVIQPQGEGPWLLPSGVKLSSRYGTVNSSRLATRIGELRQEFRYVLLDSPPVNVFSDAIALGQAADGVVLVISANTTKKDAARKARESLEIAGARCLGAVLNNRTYDIPQRIYDWL